MHNNIVIVDDELKDKKYKERWEVFQSLLSDYGKIHELSFYNQKLNLNPEAMVDKIKSKNPDLIIVDLDLLGQGVANSGIRLLKRIGQNDELINIPILVVSTFVDEKREELERIGYNDRSLFAWLQLRDDKEIKERFKSVVEGFLKEE